MFSLWKFQIEELSTNEFGRLLRDAELFKSRLGPLFGGADVSNLMVNIVQEKIVASSDPAPTTAEVTTARDSEES